MLPAGDQDEVELFISISTSSWSHVELTAIINKIIIVASSWLFILLYQWRTVTQTSYQISPFTYTVH